MQKKVQVIECVKVILNDPLFKDNHRINTDFFTRDRKLSFVLLILLNISRSKSFKQTGLKAIPECKNCIFVRSGSRVQKCNFCTPP